LGEERRENEGRKKGRQVVRTFRTASLAFVNEGVSCGSFSEDSWKMSEDRRATHSSGFKSVSTFSKMISVAISSSLTEGRVEGV
jgi:hypothetical protein